MSHPMTKRIILTAFLYLALSAASSLRAEDRMQAGLWENTVTSSGKTVTQTACLTAADVLSANQSAAAIREATEKALAKSGKGTCKLKELKIEGDRLSQALDCGATAYTTVTTYHGSTFETTSTSTKAGVAKVSLIKGRRIGVCPAPR
jgi:Protein of unknown function (DUF3617)